MSGTMRAAIVEKPGILVLAAAPVPDPAEGEVLLQVEACGLCHSDLHAIDGDWSPPPPTPLIPGHEVVGRVVGVGAGVEAKLIGQRVGVAWMAWACGQCAWCRAGLETICPNAEMTGYTRNGGFGEFMTARADFVAPVPERLDAVALAPVLCAGVTTYRGLKRSDARPGQWVLILGAGGLGHMAVQYAAAMGFRCLAADVSTDKLALATSLGAEAVFDSRDPAAEAALRDLTGGGPHAVLVTATAPSAFQTALSWVRPGGTVVFIGLPSAADDAIRVSVAEISNWEKSIRGSNVGSRLDLNEAIAFAARGDVAARTEAVGFDELPEALERLRRGAVSGRLVLDFSRGGA